MSQLRFHSPPSEQPPPAANKCPQAGEEEKSQRLLLKPVLCLRLLQSTHPSHGAQTREQSFRPSGLDLVFWEGGD